MRQTVLAITALAVIALSHLAAFSLPGTSWQMNTTQMPFCTLNVKIDDVGTFDADYDHAPGYLIGTTSAGLLFDGYMICPAGSDTRFAAYLIVPAGEGSKAEEVGGSYKFKTKQDDPSINAAFCAGLSLCVEQLEYGYFGNVSRKVAYKTSVVTPIGGPITVTDVKVSGKTKDDVDVLDGKLKVSFTGTIASGPNAGAAVKGKLVFDWDGAKRRP